MPAPLWICVMCGVNPHHNILLKYKIDFVQNVQSLFYIFVYIYLLTKCGKCGKICGPRTTTAGRISIIPQVLHFCQAKFDQKVAQKYSQNLVQIYLLIFKKFYDIINYKIKKGTTNQVRKKNKKFKKVVDKPFNIWYNNKCQGARDRMLVAC